jgi:uncharacterized protein (DUF983 family)
MCAGKKSKTGLLKSVLTNRCPRCREGKLFSNPNPYNFKSTMDMPEHCPVCGQRYELQTGFYFGTGFVSYGLSVAILAIVFVAWKVLLGLSYYDNSIFWCLGAATALLVITQPLLQRLARSIWIAFFVKYEGSERVKETAQ